MELLELGRVIAEEPQECAGGIDCDQQIETASPAGRGLVDEGAGDLGSQACERNGDEIDAAVGGKTVSHGNQLADDPEEGKLRPRRDARQDEARNQSRDILRRRADNGRDDGKGRS